MSVILRRFFLISSVCTLTAALVAFGLWRHGVIQGWLLSRAENAIVQVYQEKLRDHLPFQIEKVEYQRNWSDLVVGRLDHVVITLRKDDWRIHLDGPLQFPAIRLETFKQLYRKLRGLPIEHAAEEIELDYSPLVTFESLTSAGRTQLPDGLAAELHVNLSGEINELQETRITLTSLPKDPIWNWKALGIAIQKPTLKLAWKESKNSGATPLTLGFEASSFAYKDNVRVVRPNLALQVPLQLKPFTLGPHLQIQWKAESGEALLGDRYFSVSPDGPDNSNNPLHGQAEITLANSNWSKLQVLIGKSHGHQLHLKAIPQKDVAQVSVQLDPLELKTAIPSLLKSTANAGAPFTSLSFLQDFKLQNGKLSFSAEGSLPLQNHAHENQATFSLPDFSRASSDGAIKKANLQLEGLSFLWPAHQLAIKNLNLSIPYVAHQGFEGELAISRLGYRKLRGRLLPTRLSFQENSKNPKHSAFRIGEKGSRIPLDLDGLLLRIDSIGGTAQLSPFQYNLETRASLEPTSAEEIFRPLCVFKPATRIPPAKIQLSLPKIELAPAVADLTGYVRADLFGGTIQLDEMGMFNFLTPVPEFDFNLTMNEIDLHQLGDWVNFGEMDGTLSAYAHDVVFQSWLPTQYDFEIKVNPLHHSDVVFSPIAMKNFARLFTKEGIDNIPGYAQWLAFGWPSRLLGGYDIDYAGVHIRSEDGYIHLETLDPVTDADPYNSHQKHFILYGRRFKIPLKSSRYPLILDAPAMGNYVHYMIGQIENLAKNKKGETIHEEENPEEDKLPADCIPSDLSRL
ncbi:MAG: hypothetical protein ACJ763_04410 [Bdellovibrionia bacterium]